MIADGRKCSTNWAIPWRSLNVEFVMHEIGDLADQTLLIQSRIAQGAKKNLALIVVDPVDRPTLASKEQASRRAGKAG